MAYIIILLHKHNIPFYWIFSSVCREGVWRPRREETAAAEQPGRHGDGAGRAGGHSGGFLQRRGASVSPSVPLSFRPSLYPSVPLRLSVLISLSVRNQDESVHFSSYLLSPLCFWKPLLFHAQPDRQERDGEGVEWWRECTVHFTAVALTGWVMGQYWNGQSGRPLLITQPLWCARLFFEPCFSSVCICLVFFRVVFFQGHVGIILAHTLPDCQVGWKLKLSCLPSWN